MRGRKKVLCVPGGLLILVLVSVSLLAACGQSTTPSSNSGSTSGAPKKEKVSVAVVTEPDTLDLSATRNQPVAMIIGNNLFERLMEINPKGEVVPGLATSWKVSDDGKVVDFTLRQGVKFHTGDPFTAKDVLFSHERTKKNLIYGRIAQNIEKVEAVDDYHVRFTFKNPDVMFFSERQPAIVSKDYYDKVGEEQAAKKPVGTGPYKFVEWKPGEYIDLQTFDGYWGEKPTIKEGHFEFVKEDTARIAKLKAGEADLIQEVPFPLVKDVEASGYKTERLLVRPAVEVQFNARNPEVPWSNLKVRQAIAYAIDGDSLVKNVLQGVPERFARLAPMQLGYDPNLKPYPYDPAKAKQLLAEAGYPNGFEMPLGYQIGRVTGMKETVEAVALYLNAVGIKAKVDGMEVAQWNQKVLQWHTDPKAVYVGVATSGVAQATEATSPLDTAYSSTAPQSMYFNPQFDALITQAKTTLDNGKRGELIKQAVKMMNDDVPSVPLWASVSVFGIGKNIEFTPTLGSPNPLILLKDVKVTK